VKRRINKKVKIKIIQMHNDWLWVFFVLLLVFFPSSREASQENEANDLYEKNLNENH
jgi:hypothetical protein